MFYVFVFFFFFKQKTAYEIVDCDWSSDVCSSDLGDIQDGNYQVMSGLEQGDRIATSNILKLSDGVPVESASESES